jgi:hypothetical protein
MVAWMPSGYTSATASFSRSWTNSFQTVTRVSLIPGVLAAG